MRKGRDSPCCDWPWRAWPWPKGCCCIPLWIAVIFIGIIFILSCCAFLWPGLQYVNEQNVACSGSESWYKYPGGVWHILVLITVILCIVTGILEICAGICDLCWGWNTAKMLTKISLFTGFFGWLFGIGACSFAIEFAEDLVGGMCCQAFASGETMDICSPQLHHATSWTDFKWANVYALIGMWTIYLWFYFTIWAHLKELEPKEGWCDCCPPLWVWIILIGILLIFQLFHLFDPALRASCFSVDESVCEDENWASLWCNLWQYCIIFVIVMGACLVIEGILDGCCTCFVNAKRCSKLALFLGVMMFCLAVITCSITIEWKRYEIHEGICCGAQEKGNYEDVNMCYDDRMFNSDGWSLLKWSHVFIIIGAFTIWPCCILGPVYQHHELMSKAIEDPPPDMDEDDIYDDEDSMDKDNAPYTPNEDLHRNT